MTFSCSLVIPSSFSLFQVDVYNLFAWRATARNETLFWIEKQLEVLLIGTKQLIACDLLYFCLIQYADDIYIVNSAEITLDAQNSWLRIFAVKR